MKSMSLKFKINSHFFQKNIGLLTNFYVHKISYRNILSEAYLCENEWQKRLENPLIKNIKTTQYFIDTDKKFATKRLVSGVDIDLFANGVEDDSHLEELEHLLYRFRRTKRSIEMLDSTAYATIRVFLKFKEYDSLLRILQDRENYGVFPDAYCYNVLMDTFLKEKLYKEAAQVAVLLMLQEDFSNKINCILALYSCQLFLDNCSLDSLNKKTKELEEETQKDVSNEDDDEETLVRVPFIRNPWFDDHFQIVNPKHLIGKTFYLVSREMDDILGRTYMLIGLAMYEKWEKLLKKITTLSESDISPICLNEGISKIKEHISTIEKDEDKTIASQIEDIIEKLRKENRIIDDNLMKSLEMELKKLPQLENQDIEAQKKLFLEWEQQRKILLDIQEKDIDKEKRLKAIEEKKEYLFWKEKQLFFFENEEKILDELKEVEKISEEQKAKVSEEETYQPPEIIVKKPQKLTRYQRLAKVKKL